MNNTTSHNYNALTFDITKRDDSVTITCIDKVLHKSYQEIFGRDYVINTLLLNNVNNFYNVLNYAFEKKELSIITNQENIDICIQTTISFITLDINFLLPLHDESTNTATSLYIEKLHNKIKQLEDIVKNQYSVVAVCYCPKYATVSKIINIPNMINNVLCKQSGALTLDHCGRYRISGVSYENNELHINVGGNYSYWSLQPSLHTIRTKNIIFDKNIDKTKINMDLFPTLYEENNF